MARFIGTIDEFLHYFGSSLATNFVQRITKKYKEEVGMCEICGSSGGELLVAHLPGKDRRIKMVNVLKTYEKDGVVNVDIAEFLEKFHESYLPFHENIKVLCSHCHKEYRKRLKAGGLFEDETI